MATTANPPPGAQAVEDQNGSDPFVATSQEPQRQRYSAFDNSQFSLYLNGSPAQAKRALQAHLAETTRRLQETSQLGNALVQQRKELEEKLKEVEKEKEDNDIGPELRQKLAELEKEFNEVGRETARAFLPKSRVPSGETIEPGAGTSVFSSEGHQSPTKVSVPSRKQRNQQPSRINDIALATEISTSLLSQLKDLQAVLLEKDEALKAANLDRSQLEIEVEGLSQRLRTLDESESRLKDVNWNLETQVRDYEVQSKTAVDKENRLNHTLNLVRSEKSTLEREFEELKSLYSKLNDDHINKNKQHETELSGLRRNVSMGESERGALQRKVEELANQNSELARAVSYRLRAEDHANSDDNSQSDGADEGNTITPEHSPPPSPSKATPRHGQLESETLKHSLHHAHRMIQQLKNNIHREKTEKIELKRMLQDARDELETNRTSLNGPGSAGKRRKNDKDVFKKPARPDRLGALRTGSQEVVMDDEDWEDQEGLQNTPSKVRSRLSDSLPGAFPHGFSSAAETSAAEDFDTANETSDAAFETANERDGTSTDAFLTGAETLDGDSSDDLTETEAGPSTGTVRKRPSGLAMQDNHDVYESTASTSGDEYDDLDFKTPVPSQGPRYRLKVRQNAFRRSTPRSSQDMFIGTPPTAKDSPASFISNSNNSTPAQGKSLFAELNALSGDSEDGSVAEGTPSRSSLLLSPESSPEAFRKSDVPRSPLQSIVLPKPVMVDSSMMTDPIPEPVVPTVSHVGTGTEPEAPKPTPSMSSIATQDTKPQLPLPPTLHLSSLTSQGTAPQAILPQELRFSSLSAQDTIPKIAPLPSLRISTVSGHGTTPQSPPVPSLDISSVSGHGTVPQSPPVPLFNMSSVSVQDSMPLSPPIPLLGISSVSGHTTEPRHAPLPSLNVSALSVQGTDPISPITEARALPSLDVSSIAHQTTEPAEAHEASRSLLSASLNSSTISTQVTEPVEPSASAQITKDVKPVIALNLSSVSGQSTEPADPSVVPASLGVSDLSALSTEPLDLPRQAPSVLSKISSNVTEPIVPKPASPQLSTLSFQATKPVVPIQPPSQISVLSAQYTEPLEVPRPAPSVISLCSSQATEPILPQLPVAQLSSLSSQSTEPRELPKLPTPQFSALSAQTTEPMEPLKQAQPEVSVIIAQHTDPLEPVPRLPPKNRISDIMILQDSQPESPTLPAFLPSPSRPSTANRIPPAELAFSDVLSRETEPTMQSRPVTAQRAAPVAMSNSTSSAQTEADASRLQGITSFDQLAAQRQLEQQPASFANKDGRVPLGAIAANTVDGRSSPTKGLRSPTADEGTQTMVSAEQIDRLLLARSRPATGTIAAADVEKRVTPPSSPSRRNSNDPNRAPRRPGSSSSVRSRAGTPPPLPPDHKEVIAAAALKSPSLPPTPGAMGPPTIPASAYKKRPQTPSIKTSNLASTPKTGGTTPRPRQSLRSDTRSGASSPLTRRSSLSSFTSEIDQRFSVPGGAALGPNGIPGNTTDPRMIQAITQTMIGEYLWKYTRKAGREGHSENRHRRFFWIHPYTRTLYWSDKDPATAGKSELKAKSVAIQSVQEVPDENPLPPGLHQKTLVVTTPGRTIKFTATTSQRHETWYNALEYLLMRTDEDEQPEQERPRDEIQEEFNAGYRSSSRATGRSRASMTSYISRRTSSPHHTQVPTLRHSATSQTSQQRAASTEPTQGSVSGRFSSILRPASAMRGSFSSRRSRASAQEATTYEEPTSSNMELGRDIHTFHERDSDRMEMVNVRACCDGRHDVGHLHHHSMKSRHSSSNVNSRPSLIGSLSSRSHSRADSRNERLSHQNEMEAANSGAGY